MKTGLALVLIVFSSLAQAREPRYTVVRVDTRTQDQRLFLGDERGVPFHRFAKLDAWLKPQGKRLRFAMNAGMYEPDYSPVGLFVADGQAMTPLNQVQSSEGLKTFKLFAPMLPAVSKQRRRCR